MANAGDGRFGSTWDDGSAKNSADIKTNFDPSSSASNYGASPLSGLTRSLFGGGKKPNDTAAGDAYAAMTRQSWYDYLNTLGVPQEDKLLSYATDSAVVNSAMDQAGSDVAGAFDRQQAATQRRLSGLGLTLNAEEQQASDRSTNLSRSLADVGARNRARDQTIARQQSIISGGRSAPTLGSVK